MNFVVKNEINRGDAKRIEEVGREIVEMRA